MPAWKKISMQSDNRNSKAMKSFYILLIFIICTSPIVAQENASNKQLELINARDVTYVYPWLKHGALIVQYNESILGKNSTIFYKSKTGEYLLLSGNMESINALLRDEVGNSRSSSMQFLESNMKDVLVDLMAIPTSYHINNGYIQTGFNAKEKEILRRYVSNSSPRVTENKWEIEINVVTKYGAIEKWIVTGKVSPLTLEAFCREILMPNGTLKKFSYIGSS
jgi:hypothetical protein